MKNKHIALFFEAKNKLLSIILAFLSSLMQFIGISLIYPFIVILFDIQTNSELIEKIFNYLDFLNLPNTKYWLLFYCGTCILMTAILSFLYRIVISYSAFNYLGRLRIKILDYFLKSKFLNSSDSLSKFKNSLIILSYDSCNTLLNQFNITEKLFSIFFLIILALNFSPLLLLITLIVALIVFLIFSLLLKIIVDLQKKLNFINERLINLSDSITRNFKYVKSLGYKNFLPENINNFVFKYNNQHIRFTILNKFTKTFREPISLIALIIIFYFGLEIFKIEVAVLIITFVIMRRLFADIMVLVTQFQSYKKSYTAHEYCQNFIDVIEKDQENSGKVKISKINSINFVNVRLDFEKSIFKNLNLNFKSNETYLLKGDSGSGKTSLMMLLMGIYQSNSGEVNFNNINIKEIDLYDLRTKFSYIDQQNSIFDISLRENLKLKNNNISDSELLEILKEFKLDFDQKALDKPVNESISNFSGGQIQRINFIREIISGSEVFIFDEFTSNLDYENTNLIINYIKNKMKDKLILISSHQKEYLEFAKYIIDFNNSNIEIKNIKN